MMVFFKVPITFNVLFFIPIIITLMLFTFGCSCFVMHFGVYVEDLFNVINIVLRFLFYLTDIPYWVSVHLCRHVHAQPYVKTQRNDRQDNYDRNKAPQDAPVDMMWSVNGEELITIANKRLCKQASKETRELVRMICDEVVKVCPEFKDELVPMCVRNGGVCYEMFPCGGKNERCKDNQD
jgi:hypothetical protein